MSRDVRESLTAWFAVTAFVVGGWLAMRLLDRWPLPRWTMELLMGLNILLLAVGWFRLVRERRRLRAAKGPTP